MQHRATNATKCMDAAMLLKQKMQKKLTIASTHRNNHHTHGHDILGHHFNAGMLFKGGFSRPGSRQQQNMPLLGQPQPIFLSRSYVICLDYENMIKDYN